MNAVHCQLLGLRLERVRGGETERDKDIERKEERERETEEMNTRLCGCHIELMIVRVESLWLWTQVGLFTVQRKFSELRL